MVFIMHLSYHNYNSKACIHILENHMYVLQLHLFHQKICHTFFSDLCPLNDLASDNRLFIVSERKNVLIYNIAAITCNFVPFFFLIIINQSLITFVIRR